MNFSPKNWSNVRVEFGKSTILEKNHLLSMGIKRDNALKDHTCDKGLYKWDEIMVIVVVMVTVVEIDPKEIQNDWFLSCYSKVKGEWPSPKQSETSVNPELHKGHKTLGHNDDILAREFCFIFLWIILRWEFFNGSWLSFKEHRKDKNTYLVQRVLCGYYYTHLLRRKITQADKTV